MTAAIHAARVYLAEAKRRRGATVNRGFIYVLLEWAGNARRAGTWQPRNPICSPAPRRKRR